MHYPPAGSPWQQPAPASPWGARSLWCFAGACLLLVLGCAGGGIWFFVEAGQQQAGQAGMSGIILVLLVVAGGGAGALLGMVPNLLGLVFGFLHVQSGTRNKGSGVAGLVLNGLMLLISLVFGALVLLGVISGG